MSINYYKRRLAKKEEALFDLEKNLPSLFAAFEDGVIRFNNEVIQTPPGSRPRSFEATLFNAKIIQSVQERFPQATFGKYKRFYLNVNGYIILFKKLNGKNMPMNISTRNSQAIINQTQGSLFGSSEAYEAPVLFFGYRKNSIGQLEDPKLVYIDEKILRWVIRRDEIVVDKTDRNANISIPASTPKPKLRKISKKAQ